MRPEDTGGGSITAGRRGRRSPAALTAAPASGKSTVAVSLFVLFLVTGAAAVLSNSTFKGEQQSDINARIGQSAFLPCELEPNNVSIGFEVTTQCGTVHSVKWYRGASRIFLYSGGPRTTQPHRAGYTDRYDRAYWSTEPNTTLGFLVMDNITALDEGVYKCEITYTKVHEGCNIVQFINLTTYTDPESISVGTLAEPNDPSLHNYIDPSSDFYDDKNSNPKFGIMKKLTSGSIVGPVDEGNKIRLVCRAGRARPVPQVTWWQHSRGPIYDSDLVDYEYRKVDSDTSDDIFSYSGLWVAQSVLTVIGKRGANGRYECRVKTATDSSPILTANVEVTVNVSPYSVEMSTSSSGSTVTTISKIDDRHKSQNIENGRNSDEIVYAETTEGQPLVIRCAARGARPHANVTWYYYYKDQEDDFDDFGGRIKNDLNAQVPPVQPQKSSKHGAPVMLGNSQQNGGSTVRSPSDYLISEQRRMEGGAEIIGPVEIAQHTEYQADGTRDTHSQLSMSQLHRQQDGSIVRCDAFNNVGSSSSQPLTVNMTIRVKYAPTAWVVPITDADNSGAIIEDEIKNELAAQHKGEVDADNNPVIVDSSQNDELHYQTNAYTVVVNETKELRLQCAYHANPDKLRTPVKWYHDGIELQLVDEVEESSTNNGSPLGGSSNSRFRTNSMGNLAKYARVKGSVGVDGEIQGNGYGTDATVLIVRKLTRQDSGRYECRVRNSVGAANSTNFANVRVQYTPKVKLFVVLDDSFDENQTSSTGKSGSSNYMVGSNPVVLESEHRNVTLRCAVQLEPDQRSVEDVNSDPSLNLTSVNWYWNGVQMQLPNCTRSPDSDDMNDDEVSQEDGDEDSDFETTADSNDNNSMNVNYYTNEAHVAEDDNNYDMFAVDNDTRRRNRKQRRVVCIDKELILVNVTKNIHGNYSCRARNAAGLLTPMSDQTPLIVYFAPGPVTLEFSPRRVIKGRNVTLRCNAQYLGRPQHPTRYSWYRDGHQIYHHNQGINPNINSVTGSNPNANDNGDPSFNPEWFVDHVSLETRANFTCSAYNEGGVTYSEPVYIEVLAPPNYITGPPQYLGVAYNSTHVNASCTVECYPHCSVNWLRRGVPIDPINNPLDKERYAILTEYLPAERLKNDFEAVRSTLIWRMDNWPGGRGLDPVTDSSEYSCRSSGNDVGPAVSESIMNFSVEYPPGNMSVSKTMVHVSEGNIPEKVFCHAEGRPQPTFEWRYVANSTSQSSQTSSQQRPSSAGPTGNSGLTGNIVVGGSGSGNGGSGNSGSGQTNNQQLVLNSAVSRQQAGYYACIARNAHGSGTAYTYLDVMYKPSCQLRMLTVDQLKQETAASSTADQSAPVSELDEFLSSSAGEKRILVCTATANPGQIQFTWTIRNSGRQNDTQSSYQSSDSVATERIIIATTGSSTGTTETDAVGSILNRSILVLQDSLEVSSSDDDGDDDETTADKTTDGGGGASEGVRTYICIVNNTVGSDQCTIQVQGDAPWWKQFLASIGLGGLPLLLVVALFAIVVLIVIIIIVILFLFICKTRYVKPGNGATGGRQKYVKQKYPSLTAYRVPAVWRRHRVRGLLLNISKVRENPEGSATSSISTMNHANNAVTPKPPAGYGDDLCGSPTESYDANDGHDRQTTSTNNVVGKWPLKPGVLVHSKQQLLKLQTSASSVSRSGNIVGPTANGEVIGTENDKCKSKKSKTTSSTENAMTVMANETQSVRAERIRRMMIGSNNNLSIKPSPTSPPPAPPIRKNPDNSACRVVDEKHPSATDSRDANRQQQDNDSNLGTAGDSKAAFYENLPFHGMRPPLNQSSTTVQRYNINGKPPVPSPPPLSSPSTAVSDLPSSRSPSLIHRSPNGGYVSLLRRAISTLGHANDDGHDVSAVKFNSLQRPDRKPSPSTWHRRDHQFRSMRAAGTTRTVDRCFSLKDKNNNRGNYRASSAIAEDNGKNGEKRDGKADVVVKTALPKPAPRTRVPSASVAPPSFGQRENYANLQQLFDGEKTRNNVVVSNNKFTGVGIGARSLDEFYRMQIQQQQELLYRRVTSDDAASTLTGTRTGNDSVPHHQRQQQQQQSIEMTQFEVTSGGGDTAGDPYQKSLKRRQQIAAGYNNSGRDDVIGDGNRIKSSLAATGTNGRRRRIGDQQTYDGGSSAVIVPAVTDYYYNNNNNNNHQYHHSQHGTRRRSNAAAGSDSGVSAANGNYNTIAGSGSASYYAADVYGTGTDRQQQNAKRQLPQQPSLQRPYGSGTIVSADQTLTAKRSWRRQQNRRRRAGPVAQDSGCGGDEDDDTVDAEPAVDFVARNNLASVQQQHHPVNNGNTAGGNNKNAVKFHDVGREIDV